MQRSPSAHPDVDDFAAEADSAPESAADLRLRALRLLTRREHTRHELQRRLAPYAETPETLATLLDDLEQRRMLSDARFAEQRLAGRANRYGNRRLEMELKQRGVDESVIEQALAQSAPELERARAVWGRKFRNAPEDRDEKARQMRFLLQRGFGQSTITELFKSLANNAPET